MSFREFRKSIHSPSCWILYFCAVYGPKNSPSMQLCHLIHLWLHLITEILLSSIAQYQDHLFGLIKHSSNSLWLFCNVSLMGDNLPENRKLLEEGDRNAYIGNRDLRCLWSILLKFSPSGPLLVPFSPLPLLDDSDIKSEILLLGHLQIDDGCAC